MVWGFFIFGLGTPIEYEPNIGHINSEKENICQEQDKNQVQET